MVQFFDYLAGQVGTDMTFALNIVYPISVVTPSQFQDHPA
jgi:hypothetical protein